MLSPPTPLSRLAVVAASACMIDTFVQRWPASPTPPLPAFLSPLSDVAAFSAAATAPSFAPLLPLAAARPGERERLRASLARRANAAARRSVRVSAAFSSAMTAILITEPELTAPAASSADSNASAEPGLVATAMPGSCVSSGFSCASVTVSHICFHYW